MARGHWQIRTEVKGAERYGRVEAVPRDEAPADVVRVALRAARVIGDGCTAWTSRRRRRAGGYRDQRQPQPRRGYEDAEDGNGSTKTWSNTSCAGSRKAHPHPTATTLPPRARRGCGRSARRCARRPWTAGREGYRAFSVAGMALEYPTVDRDLNVVSLVEPCVRILAAGAPATCTWARWVSATRSPTTCSR